MKEKELEKIFKALANKRRLAILKYIKSKNRASVGDIAGAIKRSFKATSKHLMILRNVDILDREQESLQMYYSLNKPLPSIINATLSVL
ncbi:MAG: metalloregulator ArsR/SmtB family transcription factor [Candidatus Paceibacterota bacterium]|jgi:DNA-binding transcriptional ArsR family regulator